jgi:hypothetical protein
MSSETFRTKGEGKKVPGQEKEKCPAGTAECFSTAAQTFFETAQTF